MVSTLQVSIATGGPKEETCALLDGMCLLPATNMCIISEFVGGAVQTKGQMKVVPGDHRYRRRYRRGVADVS